jgi:hypothetical protein
VQIRSGTAAEHDVFSAPSDGAGGFHLNTKEQLIDIRLTGSPSGAPYVGSGAFTENDYVSPAEVLSGVITKDFNINLIGQARAPDLTLQGVTRIVISANGVERVFTDTFSAVCRQARLWPVGPRSILPRRVAPGPSEAEIIRCC